MLYALNLLVEFALIIYIYIYTALINIMSSTSIFSNTCCRLKAEVEEVLEGRTEVTYEDIESLQYTEQVCM